MNSTVSLEAYIRDSRVTTFKLCDDNSMLLPIIECTVYTIPEILQLLKKECIEVNCSEDNSLCSMKLIGESAVDALLLIQMNLNDNFEELIANSKEMEFYEISSVTRSYQNASDRITYAIDKLKYKQSFSEMFNIDIKPKTEINKSK